MVTMRAMADNEVQEYGVPIAGGAVHVRPVGDEGNKASWIEHHEATIGPVLTRTIIVVEDWHERPSS